MSFRSVLDHEIYLKLIQKILVEHPGKKGLEVGYFSMNSYNINKLKY